MPGDFRPAFGVNAQQTLESVMTILNKAQQRALKAVYDREWNKPESYLQFRRTVQPGWDCVMVEWCGMWLGIESDGYIHS